MKFQAVGDRVLLQAPPEVEETKAGGIIIPDSAKQALAAQNPIVKLEVLSAGPLCKTVKDGDHVFINMNSIGAITLGDTRVLVMPEIQIIAVERPECRTIPKRDPFRFTPE